MPVYEFKGRSYDSGQVIVGERFALNKQTLAGTLRGENILPIQITERGKSLSLGFNGRGIKSRDLALFAKQFSVMLDAGLPIVQCLGTMAEQQENERFSRVLREVQKDVEAGATLADALRKHPKVFDSLFVNMIAAGEAGGVLDVILRRLTVFLEKAAKLKRSMMSASVYPSIVISFAFIIVFVIMIWVIPVFATLFAGFNAPLPLPTRIVMYSSALVQEFALIIVASVVLSAIAVRKYYATEEGQLQIDRLLLRIPLFGSVLKKIVIARFSRTLSTLISSGIPILDGLEITAHTAGNSVIRDGILRIRKEVAEGKTIVEPMRRTGLFPVMVNQIVAVGEQTGELDQMLGKLADYYEEESDAAIANFLTMLEPLMIIVLGGIIAGIVVSMYLPIFSLINLLAQH